MSRKAEFRFFGQVPSYQTERKKMRNGTFFMSKRYKDWGVQCQYQLDNKMKYKEEAFSRCALHIRFYQDSNRRRDMDNQMKSLMDMLQHTDIITDDCWQVCNPIILESRIDNRNPGVSILITSIEDSWEYSHLLLV